MKVIVLGATGATGRLVVKELLKQQHQVIALVRSSGQEHTLKKIDEDLREEGLGNEELRDKEQLTLINGTALTLEDAHLSKLIDKADGVISCLGHNLTWKGVYGAPQMMVRDSIKRIVTLVCRHRNAPLKIVLMNSSGVQNKDQHEPISLMQHLVLTILRLLLPPHKDNEQAANYLRTLDASKHTTQWVVVRPDALIDHCNVTPYSLHPAPIRSAIFDAGKVSRINVAVAMTRLLSDSHLWGKWQGKMPLIYNSEE